MPKSLISSSNTSSTVRFGTEDIPVSIDFGRRKHLYISVNPDRSVEVKAPQRESLENVMKFVKQRADWIHLQRARFEHVLIPLELEYADGETVLYLGQEHTLSLRPYVLQYVELEDGCLVVRLPVPEDTERARLLVEQWYIDRAAELFSERLQLCFEAAKLKGVDYPPLRVGPKKRSWGTCTAKGWLSINSELIKTPLACVDYVLMHELCHLRHRNHGKAYYRLLSRLMPDWRLHKELLDRYVI